MKRCIWLAILMLVIALTVSSCGNKGSSESASSDSSLSSTSEEAGDDGITLNISRNEDIQLSEKAKAVFVDDGMLVVMDDLGVLHRTQIRCYQPSIDDSGTKVAFIGQAVLEEVQVDPETGGKNIGVTFGFGGVEVLDLPTGKVEIVSKSGGHPTISPDGTKVAFNDDDDNLMVVTIKGRKLYKMGSGEEPVWMDNNRIAYTREGQIFQAELGGTEKTIFDFDGDLITDKDSMIQSLKAGRQVFAQSDLRRYKNGQVTFAMMVGSASGNSGELRYYLNVADKNGLVKSISAGDSSTGLMEIGNCSDIVLNQSGDYAAFVEQSMNTEATVFYVRIGEGSGLLQNQGPAQLGDEGSVIMRGCTLPYVDKLGYCGDKLYASSIDGKKRIIPLTNGSAYCLADSQIDPVQLKMMDLDTKLAECDTIWQLEQGTPNKKKLCSGHGLFAH